MRWKNGLRLVSSTLDIRWQPGRYLLIAPNSSLSIDIRPDRLQTSCFTPTCRLWGKLIQIQIEHLPSFPAPFHYIISKLVVPFSCTLFKSAPTS